MSKDEALADVATALDLLGQAWRGDWGGFDGRTLRSQLSELSTAMRSGEFDLTRWAEQERICPICQSWTDHCYPETHADRA